MKFYKYGFALLAFVVVTVSGCKNEDIDNEHHYANKLYVTSAPVCDNLLIKKGLTTASREIAYRIASPVEQNIQINFDAVPSLTAAYNLAYGDHATALESSHYDIPQKNAVIKAGDLSSDKITINFMKTNELDDSRRYVLPVTILSASNIGVLESSCTAYFVFKGAALINVVANIKNIYFPINWKSNVDNLPVLTVEALLRSDDWIDKREKALSSVFGIEGKFLIRIGDDDRPRNQLQLAMTNGTFPAPNVAPGLPINEWVHIAIVYNSKTKERIYYQNGKEVASDNSASGAVSLNNGGCYIGYSWDETRWFPGDIAELRIWTTHRTPEQIAKNPYKVDPASEGLIAYWKFDDASGNTIKDYTNNGNDITSKNGNPTWVNVEIPKE